MINITTVPSSVYVIQESFKSYQGHKRNQSNSAYSLRATCRCRPQPIHVKSPPGTGCSPPSVLNPWAVFVKGSGALAHDRLTYEILSHLSSTTWYFHSLPPPYRREACPTAATINDTILDSAKKRWACRWSAWHSQFRNAAIRMYIYTLVKVSTVK